MKNIFVVIFLICSFVAHGQNEPQLGSSGIINHTIPGNISSQNLPSAFNTNGNTAPSLFNFCRTFKPQTPVTDPATINEASNSSLVQMSTEYFDGWGRNIQTIERYEHQYNTDYIYLKDCRPSSQKLNFLPFPIAGNSKFQQSPFIGQQNYFSGIEQGTALAKFQYASDPNTGISKTLDFAPGKTAIGQGRAIETYTALNAVNEVHLITFDVQNEVPTRVGFYSAGKLLKKITNTPDGSYKEEVFDNSGKIICEKELVEITDCTTSSSSGGSSNSLVIGAPATQPCPVYRFTYYVYDGFNRLRYTLHPKAVEKLFSNGWQFTNTILENLTDFQHYDDEGRLIEKHHARQKGNEYYIYDKKDRLVLKQTPLLRQGPNDRWTFTLYDKLDRPTITGLWTNNLSRLTIQSFLSSIPTSLSSTNNTTNNLYYYIAFDNGEGTYPNYLISCDILTYTYYDDYTQVPGIVYDASIFNGNTISNTYAIQPAVSYRTKGSITGKKYRILKPTSLTIPNVADWITEVYFYDDNSRIIETKKQNHRNGWDITGIQYDFKGRILRQIALHQNPACALKPSTSEVTTYSYTLKTFKPATTTLKLDNNVSKTISSYSYDALGRVATKTIGGIETQDYSYNMRGQMTAINKDYVETIAANTTKTFGEILKFDHGFSVPLYDGEISGIVWRGPGTSRPRSYGYVYDYIGQLRRADFRQYQDIVSAGTAHWNPSVTRWIRLL